MRIFFSVPTRRDLKIPRQYLHGASPEIPAAAAEDATGATAAANANAMFEFFTDGSDREYNYLMWLIWVQAVVCFVCALGGTLIIGMFRIPVKPSCGRGPTPLSLAVYSSATALRAWLSSNSAATPPRPSSNRSRLPPAERFRQNARNHHRRPQ